MRDPYHACRMKYILHMFQIFAVTVVMRKMDYQIKIIKSVHELRLMQQYDFEMCCILQILINRPMFTLIMLLELQKIFNYLVITNLIHFSLSLRRLISRVEPRIEDKEI